MKTETALKPAPKALLEWPGAEPEELTRDEAIARFRAAAFLGEPVKMFDPVGKTWKTNRDIPRPWGLTEREVNFAIHLLLHGMKMKIGRFLPAGITIDIIDLAGGTSAEEMLEVGDGWTIAPSIELDRGFRGAIKWHAFDPEGDPIAENATEAEAVAVLAGAIAAYHVKTTYHAE